MNNEFMYIDDENIAVKTDSGIKKRRIVTDNKKASLDSVQNFLETENRIEELDKIMNEKSSENKDDSKTHQISGITSSRLKKFGISSICAMGGLIIIFGIGGIFNLSVPELLSLDVVKLALLSLIPLSIYDMNIMIPLIKLFKYENNNEEIVSEMKDIEQTKISELSKNIDLEEMKTENINKHNYEKLQKDNKLVKIDTVEELKILKQQLYWLEDYRINKHTINAYYNLKMLQVKLSKQDYSDEHIKFIETLITNEKQKTPKQLVKKPKRRNKGQQ